MLKGCASPEQGDPPETQPLADFSREDLGSLNVTKTCKVIGIFSGCTPASLPVLEVVPLDWTWNIDGLGHRAGPTVRPTPPRREPGGESSARAGVSLVAA